jgi:hypothetical protein
MHISYVLVALHASSAGSLCTDVVPLLMLWILVSVGALLRCSFARGCCTILYSSSSDVIVHHPRRRFRSCISLLSCPVSLNEALLCRM